MHRLSRSKIILSIIAVGVSFISNIYGQSTRILAKMPFQDSLIFGGINNAAEADEAFTQFRLSKNLKQYGGWKWYARFLNEYGQRTNPDGSLPAANEYFNVVKEVHSPAVQNRASNGWYPLGPFNRPFSAGGLNSYGMARANCIAFDPINAGTWYSGFGQAGIWKTIDTGKTWTEASNGLPILRISDIAIDPNNPNILYCCLGDFEYCEVSLLSMDRKRNTHFGLGIYKSTDGGNSWQPTGLSASLTDFDGSLFRRVFVNPKNSNELVAAGISGIYKSYSGGSTWSKVSNATIGDLEINESNADILYAAGRWMEFSNTGAAVILKSYDFGKTWQTLNVPWNTTNAVTRVELATAPSDSNYIYAACAGGNGGELYGFYLSKNAGKTWNKVFKYGYNLLSNSPEDSIQAGYSQGKYDLALCVHPDDKNKIYLGGIQTLFSKNGGADFAYAYSDKNHVDEHQFKIHPKLKTWILCNDGGIYTQPIDPVITSFDDALVNIVHDCTSKFLCNNMNIGSYYKVGISTYDTSAYVSGAQDNGTIVGNNWAFASGGDGMDCSILTDELITSSQYGSFYYFQGGNYDGSIFSSNPYEGKGEWTTPVFVDELLDAKGHISSMQNVYLLYSELVDINNGFSPLSSFGSNRVGTAMDMSNATNGMAYFAKKPYNGGSISGKLWRWDIRNNMWTDVSAGLPDSLYTTDIAVNKKNDSFVYITYSGFINDKKIFRSTNSGLSWQNISANLPNMPVNTVVCDSADANNAIYIGTDVGVYMRNDTMKNWLYYSKNMPNVIVSDLKIHPLNHRLVASTFGRALWAYDLPHSIKKTDRIKLYYTVDNFKIENPARGFLNIKCNVLSVESFEADLLNQVGQKVMNLSIIRGENSVPVSTLKRGIYFLKIYTENETVLVEKIVLE